MAGHSRRGGWLFFLLVTAAVSLPLLLAYLHLDRGLEREELAREAAGLANQLSLWQEQLYDAKWDNLADSHDDTLHLGGYDETLLLRDSLRWYVYPDGRCFVEGMAVIDPDGSLRPSRQAAVIDDQAQPLDPRRLADFKADLPWLENPWLPDYAFVMRALAADPEREYYISPFIPASGRMVYVVASALRDDNQRPVAAVMIQNAVDKVCRNLVAPGAQGLDVWLMDGAGTVGWATTPLARQSGELFAAGPEMAQLLERGRQAVEEGAYGASLGLPQTLSGQPCQLYLRGVDDQFILGVVRADRELGRQGRAMLDRFAAIALLSLGLLALAGAVYTLASLRRQAQSVALATLRRFAGTLSHRVRNHLSSLSGNLELVTAKHLHDPERVRERLQGPVAQALRDIEGDVAELERLGQGGTLPELDGQAGRDTMFRVEPGQKG